MDDSNIHLHRMVFQKSRDCFKAVHLDSKMTAARNERNWKILPSDFMFTELLIAWVLNRKQLGEEKINRAFKKYKFIAVYHVFMRWEGVSFGRNSGMHPGGSYSVEKVDYLILCHQIKNEFCGISVSSPNRFIMWNKIILMLLMWII